MRSRNMLEGPLLSNIIGYTIPIILTGFLQLLFNAADLIIVGRFCGELSVAAVGNCGSISMLIVNLFIGLSVGTTVAVAHSIGAGSPEAVSHTVHTAVPTAIVSGIIVAIVGVFGNKTFLTMMGTPDTVLPLSSLYMKIYFMGMPFIMLYNFCASILRATGDTKTPLFLLSMSGVINVGLNDGFLRCSHDHFRTGGLRYPYRLDRYHLPAAELPHTPVSVCILYRFLGGNLCMPDDRILYHLP